MSLEEVKLKIIEVIKVVAQQQKITISSISGEDEIVDDLGFSSLSVAALIANLEEVFGGDPFTEDDVMITDIRTIDDLSQVYTAYIEKASA